MFAAWVVFSVLNAVLGAYNYARIQPLVRDLAACRDSLAVERQDLIACYQSKADTTRVHLTPMAISYRDSFFHNIPVGPFPPASRDTIR
jgi:hypothetical protein